MRFRLAIAACLGLVLIATTASAQTAYQSSSRMLVLNGDGAAQSNGGVRILRGSSAPSRTAAAPGQDDVLGPGRVQAIAGQRLWLVDQETGKLTSCRNRSTANVGERAIECTFGNFGRYRRTFGNNFRH